MKDLIIIIFKRKNLEHLKSVPSVYLIFDSISQSFHLAVNACTEIKSESKLPISKVVEIKSLALEIDQWHCCEIILRESIDNSMLNNPDLYSLNLVINNKLQSSIKGIFIG